MQTRSEDYLLDTNIVSAYLKQDLAIIRHFVSVGPSVSVVTAGELLYGALNAINRARTLKTARDFLLIVPVWPCDQTTAEYYGMVASELRSRGQTIPTNDMWIAAHALQHNLILVSRDAHFERLAALGLKLEQW